MTIPTTHLLYPTPERVAEARGLLRRESITGEYLHPAVKANCEQVLRFDEEIRGRADMGKAWEEGYGRGYADSRLGASPASTNPYMSPRG